MAVLHFFFISSEIEFPGCVAPFEVYGQLLAVYLSSWQRFVSFEIELSRNQAIQARF